MKRGLWTRTLLPPAHSETGTKRGRDQTWRFSTEFLRNSRSTWMFRVANQLSGTQVQTPRAPEVADGDQLPMLSIAGPQTLPTPSRSCAARLAALRQRRRGVVLQCIHNRCCHHGVPVSIMGKTSAPTCPMGGHTPQTKPS